IKPRDASVSHRPFVTRSAKYTAINPESQLSVNRCPRRSNARLSVQQSRYITTRRRIDMSRIYLPVSASRARLREAEHARKNRVEIVRQLSWGRVTRRERLKMG